jgi:hypothetical protein
MSLHFRRAVEAVKLAALSSDCSFKHFAPKTHVLVRQRGISFAGTRFKNRDTAVQKLPIASGDLITASTEMWAQMNRRYRIYSLSARPDSQLMWGHYADHHRGVCLEFDVRTPDFSSAIQVDYLLRPVSSQSGLFLLPSKVEKGGGRLRLPVRLLSSRLNCKRPWHKRRGGMTEMRCEHYRPRPTRLLRGVLCPSHGGLRGH